MEASDPFLSRRIMPGIALMPSIMEFDRAGIRLFDRMETGDNA
jgi:hypothetical protein